MKHMAALLLSAGLLAGCVAPDPEPAPEAEAPPSAAAPETQPETEKDVNPELDPIDRTDDTCGLDAAKGWLGMDAAEIPESDLPERARIISPSTNVTMDYVPSRLNVMTDEGGTVIGLKCG